MVKLRPIKDPGLKDKDGKQTSIPISPPIDKRMKLRKLELKQSRNNKVEAIPVKPTTPDSKLSSLEKIGGKDPFIDCQSICERALEAIESVDRNKFFCIGKGANRMFCGSVVHRVPMGAYARIGSGQCVCVDSPPVNKDDTFRYERDRQLAVKVNNKPGTDYLVVVAANGCVLIDAGACAGFNMPIYVVEQTGEYYKLTKGQRIFSLLSGHHMLVYTYEAPILFPRVDYKVKPIIKSVISSKIDEKNSSTEKTTSDEPKKDEHKKEEPKKVKPLKSNAPLPPPPPLPEPLQPESSKSKDSKDELKEESKEEDEKNEEQKKEELSLTPKPIDVIKPAAAEEPIEAVGNESRGFGRIIARIIGAIVAVLFGLLLLYLFFGGSNGEDHTKQKHKHTKQKSK